MSLGKPLSHWTCASFCTAGMWAPAWWTGWKSRMRGSTLWEHWMGVGPSHVWHRLDSGASLPWAHSNFNNREMTQGLKRAPEWFQSLLQVGSVGGHNRCNQLYVSLNGFVDEGKQRVAGRDPCRNNCGNLGSQKPGWQPWPCGMRAEGWCYHPQGWLSAWWVASLAAEVSLFDMGWATDCTGPWDLSLFGYGM